MKLKNLFIYLFVLAFGSGALVSVKVEAMGDILSKSKTSSNQIEAPRPYVPYQVIVKFKKDKINLSSSVFSLGNQFRKMFFELTSGYENQDTLKNRNVVVLKFDEGQQMEDVINDLKKDSNVEYAEPNYLLHPQSLGVNDTLSGNLWGFDNVGQTITKDNGVTSVGTSGVDADVNRAWNLSTGTSEVIVAVIDSGVAFDHADLAANMWDGTNCKDENGTAIPGGCLHGYDYYYLSGGDTDPSPGPGGSTHGTHVAGTVAATQNNNLGVAGVGPKIKIMAIKFGMDTASEVKAIDFARQNGAKVINASYGSSYYSLTENDAIANFRDAGGIFVAAAGNESNDNDATGHYYPSDYPLSNIISVAAMDQGGSLADFSNYGTTSVDVAAPGTVILSTVSYRTDMNQPFIAPTGLTPDVGSSWGIATGRDGSKLLYSDVTVQGGSYLDNSDYYLTSDTGVDLSAVSGSPAQFYFMADCEDMGTTLGGVASGDYLALEVNGDGTTAFTEVGRFNSASISGLDDSSCSGNECYAEMKIDIGSTHITEDFRYRFHWVTDSSLNTGRGCIVYDFKLVDYPPHGAGAGYEYLQGTSMASPFVAGLAGYLWSVKPSATASEIISNILSNGVTYPSLNGKVATGRMVNAYNSLMALDVITLTGPSVTGLTDDAVPTKSKDITWSSDNPSTDAYRFSIDQSISGTPSGAYSVGVTGTTYASGSGTFYIHVQAQDTDLTEGPVATASFVLDNTGPVSTVSNSSINSFTLDFGETLYDIGVSLGTGFDLSTRFTTSSGIGISEAVTTNSHEVSIGVTGVPLAGSSVNLLSGTEANLFYDYLGNAGGTLAVFFNGDYWQANPTNLNVASTHFSDLITTSILSLGGSAPESATSLTAGQNLTINIGDSGTNSSIGLTQGVIISELNDAVFNANSIVGSTIDITTVSGLEVGYTAQGGFQWGIPGTTLKFSQPTMVNIYLGAAYNGQTLYVYRSDSISSGWGIVGLSSPTCTVSGGYCSVVTTEASYFIAASSSIIPTTTPVPTSVPNNNGDNNNSNNNSSGGPPGAPQCTDRIPLFAPDLFKITTKKGSATIVYTPVNEKITGYAVMYGLKKGDERYAAMISPLHNNQGEQNFTINNLNPRVTYYFKVTAFNGCVSGPWSDWIPAKADRKRTIHKYKTVIKNKVKTLVNQFK